MIPVMFSTVAPERGARPYPRWVAVFRSPAGFRHVTLPLPVAGCLRDDAEAFAREHGIPDGCELVA